MKGSSLSTRRLLNGYSELLNVTNVTMLCRFVLLHVPELQICSNL